MKQTNYFKLLLLSLLMLVGVGSAWGAGPSDPAISNLTAKSFSETTLLWTTPSNATTWYNAGWAVCGKSGGRGSFVSVTNKKYTINPETDETVSATACEGLNIKESNDTKTVYFCVTNVTGVDIYVINNNGSGERTAKVTITNNQNSDKITKTGSAAANGSLKISANGLSASNKYLVRIEGTNGDMTLYAVRFTTSVSTDPTISSTPSQITLKAVESGVAVNSSFTINGQNLTPGTYNLTVPSVTGLTVSPTSFTVGADGKVSQAVSVSYSSTENVSEKTVNITSTVGNVNLNVPVNYSATVVAWTLQSISGEKVWDFASSVSGSKQFTGDAQSIENVYANIDGLTFTSAFDATALAFKGEFPFRGNDKKFAQNGTLRFNTTVPGTIIVKFSDTGSGASATAVKRYLVVNGVQTDYWTSRPNNGTDAPYDAQLNVTTGEIPVSVGDVTITGTSAIVMSYLKFKPTLTANVAEFKALSTGTEAQATLTDVKVTAVNGTAAYIEDATAGIKIELPAEGLLAVGDQLNGTIVMQRTADGAGAVAATSLASVVKTAGTATPTAATAEALTEAKQDMYVNLSGVTVTTDGNDVFVNQGGKTIKVVNTLFTDATATISGKKQLESIAGIVTADGLAPTKAADIVLGENADKLKTVANIAAFKALADKEQAQLTLADAYVTYKGDGFSFIQDASGAIIVEDKLTTDAAGKKLNGYFSAQLDILNNGIEKQGMAITEASDYTSADGVFIPTVYNDLSTLKSPDLLYSMVRVGRSKISIEGGVSTLETANGTGSITVRDALDTGVNVPENLTFFTGIVLYDKNGYLLAPVHEDSLQEYVASVTDYVVDVMEEGETIEAGETKVLTGVMMNTTADAPVVAEAKTVGEGDKQKNFTAKIEGNNYQFEATKTGVLTVYTEKQPKQKLNVTEDGEAMKDFTDFEQKLDSIQIPVTAGHSYLLSTTEPPLNLYGFTFTPEDKNALDLARNIATFKKLYDGMVAVEDTLMLNDAVVTYIKGDNVFVEDASGAIDFYETQMQFYVGQKLNGFIIGKNKDNKKMPVLTRSAKTKNSEFKVEKGTAQSKPITIEEALAEEGLARFATLNNVKPTKDQYGFRMLADAAGNMIRIEDHFNVFYTLPEYIKSIEGIVGIDAEGTHFFWPTSKEGVVAKPVPADFAEGKYYLKNVGSGLFWGAGNDWGTRGSLLKHAEYVTLLPQEDETFQMETQVSNGGTAYYFEGDYMDNANPMKLTINKAGENRYTIADPNGNLFGYDGTSTVLGKSIAEGDNALWQIFSEDEMKATLDAAAEDNGVDATFLILDPNFGRNNRNVGAWTMANEGVAYNLSGGNNINNCAESYMSTFVLSQEVTVPNGKYVLNAQAAVTFHDDRVIKDYDGNGYPQITANDQVSDFKEMETDDRLSNMGRLSEQFTAGKYAVEPITVYVTDGKLTIGAKSERNDIWAIWDNFELTYYGPAAAPVETARVWDFTQWSAATVDNLKADAAASKTSGWSDVEKKADAEADKEPTEASKDNCFWFAGTVDNDGELTANGVKIAETKGLKFYPTYAANRSLAIAVNYPETSLGTYAGASYLWLGGGKNSLAVFTIPNVSAGSTITVEVESHKPAEGRGIELYGAVGSDDKVVADSKIGDSFTPKTKESHSWTIENDGDVTIYNTNGCHIYILKVEPAQQKEFNVTYALAEGETHASAETVSIKDDTNEEIATLTFGEAGGNDFKAAKADAHVEGFTAFTEGNGTNGNSAGGTFYIFKPVYDGKVDFAVVLNAAKNFYIEEDGTALADFNGITVDEKKYGTFTCDVKAGSTYKVYCSGSKLGFYGLKYYNTENPVTAISDLRQAPATRFAEGVYNLRGQKVGDTLQGLQPGLYIVNGKKIVIK